MNRHVQSAALTLIHPDVPTSSAQTPYGQGAAAESRCALLRLCVCTCMRRSTIYVLYVCVCVCLVTAPKQTLPATVLK